MGWKLSVFVAFAIVGMTIGILAWPALGRTLLASGLAARIPVASPMFVAMLGNWGTHYDARPSPPQMRALGVSTTSKPLPAVSVLGTFQSRSESEPDAASGEAP